MFVPKERWNKKDENGDIIVRVYFSPFFFFFLFHLFFVLKQGLRWIYLLRLQPGKEEKKACQRSFFFFLIHA